jgi:hypothetical protein
MDAQRDDREGGGSRRSLADFRLKWLLIAFVPLSIVLAFYYRHLQHRTRVTRANDTINRLVFDAHYEPDGDGNLQLFARKGNVTDADLMSLIPIGSGEAAFGGHKVIRMELRGSKVSDEAISRFRAAAPECELVR